MLGFLGILGGLSACGGTAQVSSASAPSIHIPTPTVRLNPTSPPPSSGVQCDSTTIPKGGIVGLQCDKRMFAFNLQTLSIQDCTRKNTYQVEGKGTIYLYSCIQSEPLFAFYLDTANKRVYLYQVPSLPCIIPLPNGGTYTVS